LEVVGAGAVSSAAALEDAGWQVGLVAADAGRTDEGGVLDTGREVQPLAGRSVIERADPGSSKVMAPARERSTLS
jgi:hypothetical protein